MKYIMESSGGVGMGETEMRAEVRARLEMLKLCPDGFEHDWWRDIDEYGDKIRICMKCGAGDVNLGSGGGE